MKSLESGIITLTAEQEVKHEKYLTDIFSYIDFKYIPAPYENCQVLG